VTLERVGGLEAGVDRLGELAARFEIAALGAMATVGFNVDGDTKFSSWPTKIKFGLGIRFHFNKLRKSTPNRHAIEYSVSPRFTT
jgi:hypothetical protein